MLNQYIDLEAQFASDDEFSDVEGFEDSGFIDDGPVNSLGLSSPISTSSSSIPPLSSTPNKGLDTLLAQIEGRYMSQKTLLEVDEEHEDEFVLGRKRLALRERDWHLWQVKCTPRQEYHIIFELISKHEMLRTELRSAFYNPRDAGYVYLEAQFSKSGPQSLREVLRSLYDTKMSTLALVPESELNNCLHMHDERGFAPGQWVQIRRGLYQGDVGLVHESYKDNDSARGVKVLVVPRLNLQAGSENYYAPSSKRKRGVPRPSSELFELAKCKHALVKRGDRYIYKSWAFEHGLLLKVFNLSSVSPAREIPISLFHLFSESKKRAGKDLFDTATMPLPSFWHFDPGEKVIVHYKDHPTFGTVLMSEQEAGEMEKSWCVVDVVNQGHQRVMVRYLEKNIIPGNFVEVLRGAYTGKSGFVVGKIDDHLGICIGARTSGIDFRVHANSVKLATPNYSNTETPWLNIEVKLLAQPYAGQTGWVKDVFVDSNRSLQLFIYLCTGNTCTVGHSEVLERWTGKLLLDHQPLKPHQSQFDVEVPWKDVEVIIQSGSFASSIGIVKDVRRDFRGSLRILLWIAQHNCSVEVDHSAVMEHRTFMPLFQSLPLHDHQLERFSVNSTFEAMRTGPVPWVGLLVDFVKGEYKTEHGAVRDVNRYAVDPHNPQGRSGLTLTVERYTFSANSSNQLVKVDYSAVRYHKTKHLLCDVFMPTAKQSFYIPNTIYNQQLPDILESVPSDASMPMPIALTPMPNDFERETIFTGIWAPDYVYLDPLEPQQSPDPIHASKSPQTPDSWPASPPLPAPMPERPLRHWILHPKLLGIPIQVDINGGSLDTSTKKGGIFVKTTNSVNGIGVVCQRLGQTISIPYTSIVSFHKRPKPATEKALMVVARGCPEYIGMFVRQIHHFYENEKTEENHMLQVVAVNRSESLESTDLNFLDVHPMDLEYVQETAEERKYSKVMLQETRLEAQYNQVSVRPRQKHLY